MLHIDDAAGGEHRQAFHSAAYRFWKMHQDESLNVWSNGTWPDGFRVGIRTHRDKSPSSLVVQLGSDPEEAILTALEKWWAERQ